MKGVSIIMLLAFLLQGNGALLHTLEKQLPLRSVEAESCCCQGESHALNPGLCHAHEEGHHTDHHCFPGCGCGCDCFSQVLAIQITFPVLPETLEQVHHYAGYRNLYEFEFLELLPDPPRAG